MSYLRTRVLVSLLILVSPARLFSQEVSAARVGMRVQVVLPSTGSQRFGVFQERSMRGELVATTNDSMFIRVHPSAGVVAIPHDAIVKLYSSKGPPSRWRSALRALPSGVVVGAVSANVLFDTELRGPGFETRREALIAGAIANAVSGAVFPREQWKLLRR